MVLNDIIIPQILKFFGTSQQMHQSSLEELRLLLRLLPPLRKISSRSDAGQRSLRLPWSWDKRVLCCRLLELLEPPGNQAKKSTSDTEKDAEKSREQRHGETKTHLRMFLWYWLGLQPVLIQKLSPIDDAFFWTIMKWSKQMRKKQNLILFVKYCSWNHVTVPSI